MQLRRAYHKPLIVFVICQAMLGISQPLSAETTEIVEEEPANAARARISYGLMRFTLNGRKLNSTGPEVSLERQISQNWQLSGAFSQAYSFNGGFSTLFSSLDLSVWYSLLGDVVQEQQSWQHQGKVLAEYRGHARGGLRVGVSTQQFFFNVAAGALPFSGLAFKLLYEFSLPSGVGLGIGAEAATLANATDSAQTFRSFFSVIFAL